MEIETLLSVDAFEATLVEQSCLLCNSPHENALFCNESCQLTFASLQNQLWVNSSVNHETTWRLMQMHWRNEGMVLDPMFKEAWSILCDSFFAGDILKHCLLSLRECSGFYTCLLKKRNVITAVGLFRVHASGVRRVAEVAYVATNRNFRKEGMCKLLMDKLASCLVDLGIRDIVLPSCLDTISFWIEKHDFVYITDLTTLFPEGLNLVPFEMTVLLHKELN